ncbi:MAG TPA: LapA family protein [Acidimicrobiales bacterium]|nr:LapA family protein [Acidimicrobiales bacterium]
MSSTPVSGLPSPPPTTEAQKRQRKDIVRIVAALVIVIVLVAFVVKNSEKVTVSFVFFSANVRLIWVLVVTAILGALADRLLLWRRRKARRDRAGGPTT